MSFFYFSSYKFIYQKNIFSQCFGGCKIFVRGQINIFISKSEDGTWFYTNQWCIFGNNIFKQFDIFIGNFFSFSY